MVKRWLVLMIVLPFVTGADYYVTNEPGSGSGTFEDPFRMDDLPRSDLTWCGLSSPAIEVLQPGDTLLFREGTYFLDTCPEFMPDGRRQHISTIGYIRPARDGLPEKKITFKAYQNEDVILRKASGSQPLVGDNGKNNAKFEGFIIYSGTRFSGDGVEVAYNEFIGEYVNTSDNHDGIRIEGLNNGWVHHNIVRGVQGESPNSAGIKVYNATDTVFEDNLIFNNTAGIFDKESGIRNTYRRNCVFNNSYVDFYGNNQGLYSKYFIYDNVVEKGFHLHAYGDNTEIHDNLILDGGLSGAWAGNVWNTKLWNNIVMNSDDTVVAYREPQNAFIDSEPTPHLRYMDYNIYTSIPEYKFGEYADTTRIFTIEEMQDLGHELYSHVVTSSEIFVDEIDSELLPKWQTGGRYNDALGPENVAEVMDLTRYGPQTNEAHRITEPTLLPVEVNPVVDLNSDGIVDILDVYDLLDHWGTTDNSLYDIAPFPIGDGVVDAKDLIFLAEHLGETIEGN
jgi:parallel beta-helix repeat protein